MTTTDGTGLNPHAGAFGEDDKVVTDREGIEAVMPVGIDGRFTFPVTDYEGMQVFDANLHVIDDLKAVSGSVTPGTVLLRRETYDHSTRTAGAAASPDLQGRLVVVRRGDGDPRPDDGAQPADHLGARAHPRRPVRQVAGERPRLVDLPQPLLGRPSRCGRATTPAHPRLDVYGSFEELERDFGVPPTCRPAVSSTYVDDLVPNPDDPTGRR